MGASLKNKFLRVYNINFLRTMGEQDRQSVIVSIRFVPVLSEPRDLLARRILRGCTATSMALT